VPDSILLYRLCIFFIYDQFFLLNQDDFIIFKGRVTVFVLLSSVKVCIMRDAFDLHKSLFFELIN